mgnify:CR=1 FL=1
MVSTKKLQWIATGRRKSSVARVIFRKLNVGRRFYDTISLFIGADIGVVDKEGLTGVVINQEEIKRKAEEATKKADENAKGEIIAAKSNLPLASFSIGLGIGLSIGFIASLLLKSKKD